MFVFLGPDLGTLLYVNGNLQGPQVSYSADFGSTEGHVVLGRGFAHKNFLYGEASVDDLFFWDQPLDGGHISRLFVWYNMQN